MRYFLFKLLKLRHNLQQLKRYTKQLAKAVKTDDSMHKFGIYINYIEVPMRVLSNIQSDTVYEDCKRMFQIDIQPFQDKRYA